MTQRNSALNDRHKALGSKLDGDTWCDMAVPWSYATDPDDEVVAVRTRAGLIDMSAINLIRVAGPDAAAVLDSFVAIEVPKLKPGTARLAVEADEKGAVIDDIMIIRDGRDRFRITHGSGATPQQLADAAEGKDVDIQVDRDTHILSLQGPAALSILDPHTPLDLEALEYFHHAETELFGTPVVIARAGYCGEHGYEIYAAAADAVHLWDAILDRGRGRGVMAVSWTALDILRVEAGLLFFPFDMPEGDTTPWEIGLGWAIDGDKRARHVGKRGIRSACGKERVKQAGIACRTGRAVEPGARICRDGEEVGIVTSAVFSRYLMQSLALVHLKPDHAALGTKLTVADGAGEVDAWWCRSPSTIPCACARDNGAPETAIGMQRLGAAPPLEMRAGMVANPKEVRTSMNALRHGGHGIDRSFA
ncbi:Aminomethyltransferase [Methyloligella halotolerans]|uniref:Aminomethyltransferase n=1 Tax=Methyloligella halotolerans TaxID=1177755 RepID=A0A1E2RVV5_9HYPH|nr:Aminomethyltransferase [Methyloligella halotolerans]